MSAPNKILFPLLPFAATCLQFKDTVFRSANLRNLYTLQLFLCLYLSFVNGTIEPKSDLLMYKGYFEYSSSHGLSEVLDIRGFRDALFFAYLYLFNKLLLGNWWLFLCLTTFLTSWLMLSALLRLCKVHNLSISVSAIVYLATFNPDFLFGLIIC